MNIRCLPTSLHIDINREHQLLIEDYNHKVIEDVTKVNCDTTFTMLY